MITSPAHNTINKYIIPAYSYFEAIKENSISVQNRSKSNNDEREIKRLYDPETRERRCNFFNFRAILLFFMYTQTL